VIGERTVGHGIVRSIFPLRGGLGAIKLPIAAYYRPNGKPMNRYPDSTEADDWGVRPDPGYEVAMSDAELKQYEEDRAARDVLTEQAAGPKEFRDRQLQKALDWVQTAATAAAARRE